MDWAAFWATFSPTHLVTLFTRQQQQKNSRNKKREKNDPNLK
jgi:hypothetical protein